MHRFLLLVVLVGPPHIALAQAPHNGDAKQRSIEELRASVGQWDVVTEFLNDDGSVAKAVKGTYEFNWVVPDRVVAGRSEIPELGRTAGILFYVNEAKGQIEMVSVGGDGTLWIMTGPLGGTERVSQEFRAAEGVSRRLRFTRSHVAPDSFESRMDYTDDGGSTWKPGNHQTFRRSVRPTP